MNVDVVKIKNAVLDLSGICDDGKRSVANLVQTLVEELAGVKISLLPRQGEIWFLDNGRIGIVNDKGATVTLDFIVTSATVLEGTGRHIQNNGYTNAMTFMRKEYLERVATNAEEYYENRSTLLNQLTAKYGKK